MLRTSVILSIALAFAAVHASAQSTSTKAPKKPAAAQPAKKSATTSSAGLTTNTSTAKFQPVGPTIAKNLALSEATFHAPKGQTSAVIQPVYQSSNLDYKMTVAGQKFKDYEKYEGFILQARIDRGLDEGWSFRGEAGFAQQTVSRQDQDSAKATGFTDLKFTFQKLAETEKGQMFYGAQAGFSPSERVHAYAFKGGPSQDGNLYSGGHSISPFIGIQKDERTFIRGIRAQYQYKFDRSESDRAFDPETRASRNLNMTTSGGNTLSVTGFFERPQANRLIGAQASLSRVEATDYSISGIKMSSDAYNELGLGVYGRLPYNNEVELIPALTYRKPLTGSGGSIDIEDSSAETNLSLGARWTL